MKKKRKIAVFIVLVVVWSILVLISSIFIGDLARELTYQMYDINYDISQFVSTLISISVFIVFGISTCFLGVSMLYICFGFSNDKEK